MKAREEAKVSVLRMLWAVIKNKQFELRKAEGLALTDEEVAGVVQKEIKQRRDSIEAYRAGNRPDLVQKEEEELALLGKYVPQQLTPDELAVIVDEAVSRAGAAGLGDFGKVMGILMPQVKGKADGNMVAGMVRKRLEK